MLFLLILVRLQPEKCAAALKSPPPIEGGKLLLAQVLFRHGARSPSSNYTRVEDTGNWTCDVPDAISPRFYPAPVVRPRNYRQHFDSRLMPYPPSCREQDLLTLGMEQEYELGQTYRKYLVDDLKILPEHFNPAFVKLRSTNVDRAMRSTMSFISGMYPPQSRDEVIELQTDSNSASFLVPPDKKCKELEGFKDKYFETQEFKDYFENEFGKFKDFVLKHGIKWKPAKVHNFVSYINMVYCTNHIIPNDVPEGFIDASFKYLARMHFGPHDTDELRGVGASPLLREMFRMADDRLSMKNQFKFVLLGSHDTEIGAFMPVFGYKTDMAPVVRSHVLFELWEVKDQVLARISYNGEPIPVDFLDNQITYPYSHLRTEMNRLGFLSHCFLAEEK